MIGSKKTSESDVKQELLSCIRLLLLTYAAITPPWATQSFTTYIMAYLCQLATPLWSEKLTRVGWRDTSNRPDERGGQEHPPGGKNIVSELVEAVRCAKSLGSVLAVAVVSYTCQGETHAFLRATSLNRPSWPLIDSAMLFASDSA
jgi:hypothetical protein